MKKETKFKAGQSGNPNGRPKGVGNRTTTEIREHFQNLVSENLGQLSDDLKELEPMQRLKIIIELSKFVVPILKATDLNLNGKEDGDFKEIIIKRIVVSNSNEKANQN
jgi:hypothetical protein